jgi:hypothetical protein
MFFPRAHVVCCSLGGLIRAVGAQGLESYMRIVLALMTILFLSALASGQSNEANQKPKDQSILNRQIHELPAPQRNFRPRLTLQQALKLAEAYAEKEKIDMPRYYLLAARMIQYGGEKQVKEPRWFFLWASESGEMGNNIEISVSMEGKITRHPSM